jgi:hypothetical protein
MSRGPWTLKPANVTKAVQAVTNAGVQVARVEILPDGRIVIIAGAPGQGQDATTEVNEWDAVE